MGQLLSPDFVSPKTSLGTHKTSISRIDHIVGMFYIISIYCICHFHRILVPDPRFIPMICWDLDLGSLGSGICWDPIIVSSQIESRIDRIPDRSTIFDQLPNFLGHLSFFQPSLAGAGLWVKLTIQCKMLIFIRLECNLYLTKVRRVHKNFPSTKSNPA